MALELVRLDPDAPLAARPVDERLRLERAPTRWRLALGVGIGIATGNAIAYLAGTALPYAVAAIPLGIGALALRNRRVNARIAAAIDSLNAGDVDAATRAFVDLAQTSGNSVKAMAVQNLGYVAMRTGDFARALTLFSEVYRDGPSGRADKRACADGLAMTYALMGDLDEARYWLAWGPHPADDLPSTSAVVLALSGRLDEVVALRMVPFLSGVRQRVAAHEMRVFFAVRAFARAELGESYDRVHKDLTRGRPEHPRELSYLAEAWPSFASFLGRHPLDPKPHAPHATLPIARVVTRPAT